MNAQRWSRWMVASALAGSLTGCRLLAKREPEAADVEEEAAEKVTPSNYKAELARLKKDIANK
jgi:hypothetical protein